MKNSSDITSFIYLNLNFDLKARTPIIDDDYEYLPKDFSEIRSNSKFSGLATSYKSQNEKSKNTIKDSFNRTQPQKINSNQFEKSNPTQVENSNSNQSQNFTLNKKINQNNRLDNGLDDKINDATHDREELLKNPPKLIRLEFPQQFFKKQFYKLFEFVNDQNLQNEYLKQIKNLTKSKISKDCESYSSTHMEDKESSKPLEKSTLDFFFDVILKKMDTESPDLNLMQYLAWQRFEQLIFSPKINNLQFQSTQLTSQENTLKSKFKFKVPKTPSVKSFIINPNHINRISIKRSYSEVSNNEFLISKKNPNTIKFKISNNNQIHSPTNHQNIQTSKPDNHKTKVFDKTLINELFLEQDHFENLNANLNVNQGENFIHSLPSKTAFKPYKQIYSNQNEISQDSKCLDLNHNLSYPIFKKLPPSISDQTLDNEVNKKSLAVLLGWNLLNEPITYFINKNVVEIGRDCEINLKKWTDVSFISHLHAKIQRVFSNPTFSWNLISMGRNGTRINGILIGKDECKTVALNDGDCIQIGSLELTFRILENMKK